MNKIPYLKTGSKVAIAAPARKVSKEEILPAVNWLKEKGFVPVFDDSLFAEHYQFAGDDETRAAALQRYIDDPEIDAILMARGGYGTLRIIDKLNYDAMREKPKWIVGYSDVTVLHGDLQRSGYESIHATMPLNFSENTPEALESLYAALTGKDLCYEVKPNKMNKLGKCSGRLVGGNLSVLYSMIGSKSFPEMDGNILFFEDLDEYLYHIDRMLTALSRCQFVKGLKGIVVGAMTKMHDNTIPFGYTIEEMVTDHFGKLNIPIAFDIPAGHIDDNRALIMNRMTELEVTENGVKLLQKAV